MSKKKNPARILIYGFLSFILLGTALLMLPVSTVGGISIVDAFFTSTSAICVTGLIVKDTPNDFTFFGQVIILLLIHAGGFGYMTSATIVMLLLGKRIGLSDRLIMKEALNVISLEGIVKFAKGVFIFTLLFESAGALLLSIRFMRDMPTVKAVYYGIFHSVSAFNNAGFSLFSDSLIKYRGDWLVNLVIAALIISGGIGFIVISDLFNYFKGRLARISLHTKIVLSATAILITAGTLLIFIFEYSNPNTFIGMPLNEKFLAAFFASVTTRTAGFNTIDYSNLRIETLFLSIILMFIGASPGGTGGGIKTTTFALVIASLCAMVRGARDTVMFRRRIPLETVSKSFLIATLAALFVVIISLMIIRYEDTKYLSTVFEVTSAFGTVGLSVGDGGSRSLTSLFTPIGKLLISFAMFAGRLGPLTLVVAVVSRKEEHFRYPEGRIALG
jgi:trk system potassium uptake protein TrkH